MRGREEEKRSENGGIQWEVVIERERRVHHTVNVTVCIVRTHTRTCRHTHTNSQRGKGRHMKEAGVAPLDSNRREKK